MASSRLTSKAGGKILFHPSYSSMKVVAYNISRCTQGKIDYLLDVGADMYILPECAESNYINLPVGYEMLWIGDDDVPQKGLGVVWRSNLRVSLVDDFKKIKHHLPLLVDDGVSMRFVLACWPTVWKEPKSYPQLLLEAIRQYAPYFKAYPSIAVGDYNCYVGQASARRRLGMFEDCIAEFEKYGLRSLYHEMTGECFGCETEPTFYWRFKEDSPYFLDYAFCNFNAASFSIGKWEKEISDHRPLIIEW